jgi:hypothetical protein
MSASNYENTNDPWKLIDSPFGTMEQWRADALTIGGMGAYSDYMRQTIARFDRFRNDSISFVDALKCREANITAREDAVEQREQIVSDLMGKAAQLLDRINNQLSDAEKFAEPISLPPGDDSPGEQREADDNAEPGLSTSPGKEPEPSLPVPTTDEELPQELARLEPEEHEPPGTVQQQPTSISLW